MNLHGKDIKIFTANSNPKVAAEECICVHSGRKKRGKDILGRRGRLHQSAGARLRCGTVHLHTRNNNLMELLIMIDAFERFCRRRVRCGYPVLWLCAPGRKAKARDRSPQSSVADLITAAGADRVLTMDLHAAQIQGFFDIPVGSRLLGVPILLPHFIDKRAEPGNLHHFPGPGFGHQSQTLERRTCTRPYR